MIHISQIKADPEGEGGGAISPLDKQMLCFFINKLLLTGRQLAKGRQLAQTSRQETFCDALELGNAQKSVCGRGSVPDPARAVHDAPRTPNSRLERVNRIPNPPRCLGRSVSDHNARPRRLKTFPTPILARSFLPS